MRLCRLKKIALPLLAAGQSLEALKRALIEDELVFIRVFNIHALRDPLSVHPLEFELFVVITMIQPLERSSDGDIVARKKIELTSAKYRF